MANKRWSIGVDIGGTHLSSAVVELSTGQLEEATLARATFSHEAPADTILQQWATGLNDTLAATGRTLAGIGFAIPGPFDYRNGISKMEHKFKSLYDVHIPTALHPLLHTGGQELPMRFVNDATAFAVGESWMGQGRPYSRVVVITLGTGFGSAFLEADVPVVRGNTVPPEGCLWHVPFRDGIADDYFSTRWFTQTYSRLTGRAVTGVRELVELADSDPRVDQMFEQFGTNLAECLAPWLRNFRAEVLIIGGNIAHTLSRFGPALETGLQAAGGTVKITPSVLWERAALLGSARLLDEPFWNKIAIQLPNL
ncbi:MAG: ROK family protein [Bacteroidetes bacterium]|nr:MAG: ROK family protein [Bacteroidota bacterium]